MSEAQLWLNYCLSAGIALAVVYLRNWRIVSVLLLGTAISLALYLAVSVSNGAGIDDPWLVPSVTINGSFALIFAALGAAIGCALRSFRNT